MRPTNSAINEMGRPARHWLWFACAALLTITGCNSFGNGKLVQQLQGENERLLSEFRAQRDRNAELLQANQQLEDRIAQTEKQLALEYQAGEGRLTQRNNFQQSAYSAAQSLPMQSAVGSYPSLPSDSANLSNAPAGSQSGLNWRPR